MHHRHIALGPLIIVLTMAAACAPGPVTATPSAATTGTSPEPTLPSTTTPTPLASVLPVTAPAIAPARTPSISATPILATDTPRPTASAPIAPFTSPMPTATLAPATHSVCASGCDFTTLQTAVDAVAPFAIIEVRNPVHTEAGIVIDKSVTVRGLGGGATIIQGHESLGQAPERVFHVTKDATVVLENMTIRHGKPSVEVDGGGGILNEGTLTVSYCIVSNNRANDGGGIRNTGDLTVLQTIVRNNVADVRAPIGYECDSGGGIKSSQGTLRIINSTISGNQAGSKDQGRGGGVFVSCACQAEIVNSTISGNKAAGEGGGIAVMGTLLLTHATVARNISRTAGAGIYVRGQLNYESSIIAQNFGKDHCAIGGPGDYRGKGSIGLNSNNLVEDGSCAASLSGDALLAPLADNGGPTMTHALLAGSPAIDVLAASTCPLNSDQRGAPRPVALTSTDTPCDLGAFELQGP
jgi:hypothetical protein